MSKDILVLYVSRYGSTELLAREVCKGIDGVKGTAARLRTVPAVSHVAEASQDDVPAVGPPYASLQDLDECAGLVMGSPTRFGNMDASLKYFLDSTTGAWMKGSLTDKPFGVFTSTSSLHGGAESTLLTMAIPLLHHGMVYVGLPYSEPALTSTRGGGSPYGAGHVTFGRDGHDLSGDEKTLASKLGERVARLAARLTD